MIYVDVMMFSYLVVILFDLVSDSYQFFPLYKALFPFGPQLGRGLSGWLKSCLELQGEAQAEALTPQGCQWSLRGQWAAEAPSHARR